MITVHTYAEAAVATYVVGGLLVTVAVIAMICMNRMGK